MSETLFQLAVAKVLEEEGGYVVDPNDPGGATNWGVSHRSYPTLDIENLTRDDAIAIYRRDFWTPCRCDDLPPMTAVVLFDASVNQGVGTARMALQSELHVVVDGVLGPATLAAVAKRDDHELARALMLHRILQYITMQQFHIFGRGWMHRVLDIWAFVVKL